MKTIILDYEEYKNQKYQFLSDGIYAGVELVADYLESGLTLNEFLEKDGCPKCDCCPSDVDFNCDPDWKRIFKALKGTKFK